MWEFCLRDTQCNKLNLLYLVLFLLHFHIKSLPKIKDNCIVLQKNVTVTIVFIFYEGFDKKQSQSFWGDIILIWVCQENIPWIKKYIQGNSKYSALLEFIFQNCELPHLLNLWSVKDKGALYAEKADASSQDTVSCPTISATWANAYEGFSYYFQ